MQHPVVIIGAGAAGAPISLSLLMEDLAGKISELKSFFSRTSEFAGLYAAHVLQKEHNVPVEVVEAADYVGGRVKQVQASSTPRHLRGAENIFIFKEYFYFYSYKYYRFNDYVKFWNNYGKRISGK
jgi:hypothetical protein